MKRTDLAVEFVPGCKTKRITKTLKRTDVVVDEALSEKLRKPCGIYITIESDAVKEGKNDEYDRIARELADALKSLKEGANCLIAGLGNPNMTADALGKHVADRLMITRHIETDQSEIAKISCVCPNVLGVTGIESFDIVRGVCDRINPDCVIVIDSLAGAATTRIASAFQISSAGITPGSGVSNHRLRFDSKSLGRQVLSIGVPLVVYASTIIEDALGGREEKYDRNIGSLIVTPKDIDLLVEDCASIIAKAINICFFGESFDGLNGA